MELTILCTAEPYFSCEHGMYIQSEGTPMGGPLSSLLADLVIENMIEAKIATCSLWKRKWDWVRKADDTFMEWTHSIEQLHQFHTFLNTLHPTIKWTMEIEENNQIPFLDVLVLRQNNQIQTTVYRKPSASDRYTHFTSAQAWREKISTIQSLYNRALTYCSTPELFQAEIQHLHHALTTNGYPAHILKRYLNPGTTAQQNQQPDHEPLTTPKPQAFYAPYHPAANQLFHKLKNKFNIDTIFQKTTTLKDILYHTRPSIPDLQKPGAVYALPCQQNCPKVYFGETKRTAQTRLEEEKRDIHTLQTKPNHKFKSDYNDIGYITHSKSTKHQPNFNAAQVLTIQTHHTKRKLIEGLYIHHNTEIATNMKAGTAIDKSWLPILNSTIISEKYKFQPNATPEAH